MAILINYLKIKIFKYSKLKNILIKFSFDI
jgi:hypothetical protein